MFLNFQTGKRVPGKRRIKTWWESLPFLPIFFFSSLSTTVSFPNRKRRNGGGGRKGKFNFASSGDRPTPVFPLPTPLMSSNCVQFSSSAIFFLLLLRERGGGDSKKLFFSHFVCSLFFFSFFHFWVRGRKTDVLF